MYHSMGHVMYGTFLFYEKVSLKSNVLVLNFCVRYECLVQINIPTQLEHLNGTLMLMVCVL